MTDNEDMASGDPNGPQSYVGRFSPGAIRMGTPINEPADSTPLEEGESEGPVPAALLWAMKDRRHLHLLPEHAGAKQIRAALSVGDNAIFAIDDGHTHCMISRRVGSSPDGCTYCLVGRISLEDFRRFANGELALNDIFAGARDLELCGVFENEQEASNVLSVRHFPHIEDVPREYLPPSPFIAFPEDLSADP